MTRSFQNRTKAGQLLAQELTLYADRSDTVVLGLPRGGVPVAFEIAMTLGLPLDICLVRKLGTPQQEELAMGAIAPGGIRFLDQGTIERLQLSKASIIAVIDREQAELERREHRYRNNRPRLSLQDHTVIVVDDGVATGATLLAAIASIRSQKPRSVIVAVPVAALSVCELLEREVDRLVCLSTPEVLHAVGCWYQDFSQTSDQEVCDLLEKANQRQLSPSL